MPRQEKNASEKRKQVEKGGSHPCMRASVCVNVARTPYRGLLLLLLSPPFFLPFFSLLYLLCAPLYAPLLALRSRVRARKLLPACSTLLLRFLLLLLLLLLLPLCFVLAFLSIRVTSPLPQIRFLSKIVSSSMAPLFSLRKFPRRFLWFLQSRFFSTHLFLPVCSLLFLFFSFSLSFPFVSPAVAPAPPPSPSFRTFCAGYFVFVLSLYPRPPHAPGGKMTRTNRCCNFVITTVCSSTLLTKNRYRERSLRASRARPAAEKFFGYNPSAWRT